MGEAEIHDTGWGRSQVDLKKTSWVRRTPTKTQALVGEGEGALAWALSFLCELGRDELLGGGVLGLDKGPQ